MGTGGKEEIFITNYQLPIINAPCPMPFQLFFLIVRMSTWFIKVGVFK
ncbi:MULTISPECIES: hypothetical protein [unclassified Tolypothrix]|nr:MULTISPECIES: hypothetical protein [unclassified Tolypothrix]UYD36537.1 hypothetical protein HG267_12810 [Tolypothrix sp. PCC 7601]